ncbi:MAG: hypothetical protein KOO63_06820 [Bacteroidales bacterium]|nr:hypothetical protein [Candidatus Latescibacterota bacterium]
MKRLAMPTNLIVYALLILGSAGGGFIIGRLFEVPGITCQTTLDPMQGFSIALTMGLAAFFGVILSRKDKKADLSKELTMGRLAKLDDMLEDFETMIVDDSLTYHLASTFRKRVHGTLECVWTEGKLAENSKIPEFGAFETAIGEIHHDMTWVDIREQVENQVSDVVVQENMMIFSSSRMSLLLTKIGRLRNLLFSLQHKVNWM